MDCLSTYRSSILLQTANCRGSSVVEQCLDKALAKSSILFLGTKFLVLGDVAEWLKAADCKSVL